MTPDEYLGLAIFFAMCAGVVIGIAYKEGWKVALIFTGVALLSMAALVLSSMLLSGHIAILN